jgi:hypothetical protein
MTQCGKFRVAYFWTFSFNLALNFSINPYSVLTPPGGVLEFIKIIQFINIFLFLACFSKKIFDFVRKTRNMSDAVRVKIVLAH